MSILLQKNLPKFIYKSWSIAEYGKDLESIFLIMNKFANKFANLKIFNHLATISTHKQCPKSYNFQPQHEEKIEKLIDQNNCKFVFLINI